MITNRFLRSRFSRAAWVRNEADLAAATAHARIAFDAVDAPLAAAIKRLQWTHVREVAVALEGDDLTFVDAFPQLEALEVEGPPSLASAMASRRAPRWLGLSMPTVWPQTTQVSSVQGLYAVSRNASDRAALRHHLEHLALAVAVLSIDSSTEGPAFGLALPRLRELDLREPSAKLPIAPQLERLTLRTTQLEEVAEAFPRLRELTCLGDVPARHWPLLSSPTLSRLACYSLPTTLAAASLDHLQQLELGEVDEALLAWLGETAPLNELERLRLPETVSERWACRLLERFGATLVSLEGPWLRRAGLELVLSGGAPALAAMTVADASNEDFGRLRASAVHRRLTTLRWIGRLEVDSVEAMLDPLAFLSLKHLWLEGPTSHLPEGLRQRLVARFGRDVFL